MTVEPATTARSGPVLIGLDGRSGAGKSTLAAALAERLAPHASVRVLHVEDMYPGWDGLAAAIAPDGPYARAVHALARGRAAAWTSWDWHRSTPGEARVLDPAGVDVVVCEGVGALCCAARDALDLRVWIDRAAEERRVAALARDGAAYAPHWEQWAAQEERYLGAEDPAGAADVRLAPAR